MKKLVFVFGVLIYTCGAMGQDKMQPDNKQAEKSIQDSNIPKDYIMMKNSKMIFIKDSEIIMMNQEMVLSNGTLISLEGKVTMIDGKTITMRNGDMMNMDGIKISKRK